MHGRGAAVTRRVQLSLANQDVRGFASWHQSCSGFAHEPRRGVREDGHWRLHPDRQQRLADLRPPRRSTCRASSSTSEIVQKAERYGFDFALSMIKLRGFGGKTEFWDHNLESFTLMAGLAAVTSRIRLYASTAVLTCRRRIVARMAITIDDISPRPLRRQHRLRLAQGRIRQMGLWPGDEHFGERYDYCTEYVADPARPVGNRALRPQGRVLPDGRLPAQPAAAGADQAGRAPGRATRGMEFAAEYCDYNFALGEGVNTPAALRAAYRSALRARRGEDRPRRRLLHAVHGHRRRDRRGGDGEVGPLQGGRRQRARWPGIGRPGGGRHQARAPTSTAAAIALPTSPINFNMGTLVGSYATVARMLDEVRGDARHEGHHADLRRLPGRHGAFGQRIQPLMACRAARAQAAA